MDGWMREAFRGSHPEDKGSLGSVDDPDDGSTGPLSAKEISRPGHEFHSQHTPVSIHTVPLLLPLGLQVPPPTVSLPFLMVIPDIGDCLCFRFAFPLCVSPLLPLALHASPWGAELAITLPGAASYPGCNRSIQSRHLACPPHPDVEVHFSRILTPIDKIFCNVAAPPSLECHRCAQCAPLPPT